MEDLRTKESSESESNDDSDLEIDQNLNFFSYVWGEISRNKSLNQSESYRERWENVYVFWKIMWKLESLMYYGLLCCCDNLLSTLTIIPTRCFLAVLRAIIWPVTRIFGSTRRFVSEAQMMDIARLLLVAVTCCCWFSPIVYFNPSVIYHTIKGQELLKLYIIFNMLEVAERLVASIGQDAMDTLFYTISSCSFYRVLLHFFISIVYMFLHSFIMLVQATTLNVAFNLHNKILLIIMMSNNFIELKGSVFKRFDKNYLFQVACADVRERFHLFWLLCIVLVRNMSQHQWNIVESYDLVPYMLMILTAEFFIDWMKHAFIIKFNSLTVDIYPEYRKTLTQEFLKSKNPRHGVDHIDLVSRRMAYSPLPLAAVIIHMTLLSFKVYGGSSSQFNYATMKILAAVFLNLFLFKVIVGLLLVSASVRTLREIYEVNKFNEKSPKIPKLVDPYEQLPRNTSSKNIRDRSDTSCSATFAASVKESSSPATNSPRKNVTPASGKHSSKNHNSKT